MIISRCMIETSRQVYSVSGGSTLPWSVLIGVWIKKFVARACDPRRGVFIVLAIMISLS